MDLWRASALQNAFSGASAHDDSAARAAEDNYMCVRRQLRIYKLWVWVSRIAFGVRCVRAQPQTEGMSQWSGFPARRRSGANYLVILKALIQSFQNQVSLLDLEQVVKNNAVDW